MGRPVGFTVHRQQSIANIGAQRGAGLWGWEQFLVDDSTFCDVTVAFDSEQVQAEPDSKFTRLKITFVEVTTFTMWDDDGNDLPDDQIPDEIREAVKTAAAEAFEMHKDAITERLEFPMMPAL